LKDLHSKAINKLNPCSCFISPQLIPVETEATVCHCGCALRVQKTQCRTVILLDLGRLVFKERIKFCPACKSRFGAEKLDELVPEYSNFSYEVIEFIGRQMFVEYRTEKQVRDMLAARNVAISPSEVSLLSKKFILYLAQAHKDKEQQIKGLIHKKGGYVAHLDGTCDGDSPHFFCVAEELSQLVLISRKIPSESVDAIVPILQELANTYGNPLALVCDMSPAILGAIERVFPGMRIFICHFHFLRDLGKDLLKNDHEPFLAALRDLEVKPTLSKFSRTLRDLVRNHTSLSRYLEPKEKNFFDQKPPEAILAHLLVEWVQNYKSDLRGYGYPFDRDQLALVKRMEEAYQYLQKLTLKPGDRLSMIKNFLEEVFCDTKLQVCLKALKKKVYHFDLLRAIMRIAPLDGKDGLNDDGDGIDIPKMKEEFEKFIALEEIKEAAERDIGYKKLLAQVQKYKERLFTDGLEIVDEEGNKHHIQPERTNNSMERLFRGEKRGVRKRTGCKKMNRALKTMIAETPYVKNLKNQEYFQIILNGKKSLAERFAEINSQQVRKAAKKHFEDQENLCSRVRQVIADDDVLENIMAAYTSLTHAA
jgi:hypothetical protein